MQRENRMKRKDTVNSRYPFEKMVISDQHHKVVMNRFGHSTSAEIIEISSDESDLISLDSVSDINDSSDEAARIGPEYQAVVPRFIPESQREPLPSDHTFLIWRPVKKIHEAKLNAFFKLAKQKYKYNDEQALGILFWHNYNLRVATKDLSNFSTSADGWNSKDKLVFAKALQSHRKDFRYMQQMPPGETKQLMVGYYYSWKKTQPQQMEQSKPSTSAGTSDDGNLTCKHMAKKRKLSDSIAIIWSSKEIKLLIKGLKKYGGNFTAIANTLASRTSSDCCNFYITYYRRYRLDRVMRKYEKQLKKMVAQAVMYASDDENCRDKGNRAVGNHDIGANHNQNDLDAEGNVHNYDDNDDEHNADENEDDNGDDDDDDDEDIDDNDDDDSDDNEDEEEEDEEEPEEEIESANGQENEKNDDESKSVDSRDSTEEEKEEGEEEGEEEDEEEEEDDDDEFDADASGSKHDTEGEPPTKRMRILLNQEDDPAEPT